MIKAQELRLGNIVLRDGEYHVIDAYDILSASVGDIEFEGVVLTGGVLVKCGFEEYPDFEYEKAYKIGCSFTIFTIQYNKGKYTANSNNCWCVELHSLHQLQNLFFALGGKELIITL